MAAERVKDQAIKTLHEKVLKTEHPLEILAGELLHDRDEERERHEAAEDDTLSTLTPQVRWTALEHSKVYLDEFIGVIKGGPTERTHLNHHLFCSIYEFFHPTTTKIGNESILSPSRNWINGM